MRIEDKGTYHTLRTKLYNTTGARHQMEASQAALDAVHAIQETEWSINAQALAFVTWLQGAGSESPLGFSQQPEATVRLSTAEFLALSKADKREVVSARKRVAADKSKRKAGEDRITIAREIAETGSTFYQPQFLDFRGRVYPKNSLFNNQADHWSKGLMVFAQGTALGETGLDNLKIHTATCWGEDKSQLEERIQWIEDNMEMLRAVAGSFLEASSALVNAGEPLAAYAATVDLIAALDAPTTSEYVSGIPCAIDGTCNGLQILSLLGHDEVGANKTNCTSNPIRQDVYREVADEALILIRADLASEEFMDAKDLDGNTVSISISDLATTWLPKIEDADFRRKAVKRAIMTTAYGVSDNTIKNNLIEDKIVDKLTLPERLLETMATNGLNRLLASYMRDKILEARTGAIQSALQIMDYFNKTAGALGACDVSMAWTTPDGLRVKQDYRKVEEKRFRSTDVGELVVSHLTGEVDARKCASGAAPQVVHSLDAAMLRMVAKRLSDEGIEAMAMIHDSYGVAAGSTDRLHRIIREVAVEIFQGDWLTEAFNVEQAVHGVELPPVPAQGDLDLSTEVANATYFFS